MIVLTSEQIRAEERRGAESGIGFETMMTAAGENAGEALCRMFPDAERVAVVCGKGRNGGDGFVAARYLKQHGKKVYLILAFGAPTQELCVKMYGLTRSSGILAYDFVKSPESCASAMKTCDLLVDAVFGIGFSGALRGNTADLAELYNSLPAKKAALDLPSGLSADRKDVPALYYHADATVTMHAKKPCHILSPAAEACGETAVVSIGFEPAPADVFLTETERRYVVSCFRPRARDSHKGSYGTALSVCGSRNMPGAAVMAAKAAAESGAGLVCAAFPERAYQALTAHLCEPVFLACPDDAEGGFSADAVKTVDARLPSATAVLFGCGAGQGEGAGKLLDHLIRNTYNPLIIDADGINLVASHKDVLKERPGPTLLTPHPGEMSRLTGKTAAEINADRIGAARDFALKYGVHLLLKGSGTVIASPQDKIFLNPTGNPGMAVGGSGDVLSGMILSFAAQGLSLFDAAVCGAYLHGAAGDLAAQRYSMAGTTPLRMLEALPEVLLQIEKEM